MRNLTLTISELKALIRVSAYISIVIGAVIAGITFLVRGVLEFSDFYRAFSTAIAVAVFIVGGLHKASWKSDKVARWMGRPVVHGVWCGTLISDFKAKSGVFLKIPIVFVIRQTYLSLSVQSFTPGQIGTSVLEALVQDSRNGDTRLRYVFELTRLFNNENKVTKGSGEMRLQNRNSTLHGFYWTSTPTHGEIRLKRMSRDCEEVDCFDVALEKWPAELAGGVREVPFEAAGTLSPRADGPLALVADATEATVVA